MASAGIEPHECACIVGLDSDLLPIQSGCACRSDTGLAHVGCLIEKAVAQQPYRGYAVWWECQTCGQPFTGRMQTGLAEAWWSRVCDEAEESGLPRRIIWPKSAQGMGSTRRRSGSTGRCLVWTGGYSARSIRTR
jgi:hypothetical protein